MSDSRIRLEGYKGLGAAAFVWDVRMDDGRTIKQPAREIQREGAREEFVKERMPLGKVRVQFRRTISYIVSAISIK